jgi:cyclophilin family peptidyl-prolyl cis-trans isomerase
MRLARLAALLCCIAASVAGCGLDDGKEDAEPSRTAIEIPVDADISSGCWTAEQRALSLDLEGDKRVGQWTQQPAMAIDTNKTYVAILKTSKGDFEITFFPKEAPNTVNNFVCLARAGFYNDTTFHRIMQGFVIQGGDPEGTGRGGPGYRFNDEPVTRDYKRGIVAMANAGPNTNGSQFFVCLQDIGLPKNYTIFGEVTNGMDVVDQIAAVPTRKPPGSNEQSTPIEPVTVESVTIAES